MVKVGRENVRVVDRYGEFGEDVLVAKAALLESLRTVSACG